MRSAVRTWTKAAGWGGQPLIEGANLVFVFGDRLAMEDGRALGELVELHPGADIVGCSTAGEIQDTCVTVDGVVAAALAFDHSGVQVVTTTSDDSASAGSRLAGALAAEGLRHVLVFSEGSSVNGTELTRGLLGMTGGLARGVPPGVSVTGGLAGDAERFERTFVIHGGDILPNGIVGIGLYGERLRIGCGSMGGWDPFGPDRVITRSEGNTLYQLDGKPALALYKQYLGPHADDLPSSALLFPLLLQTPTSELVRTILGVNEEDQSMLFAGDVPEGATVRLMKANFERIVDGAAGAAEASTAIGGTPEFALLVSCVGRRLILKQRTEDELEAVRHAVGPAAVMAGFYSYGELGPSAKGGSCELHNQTMTITTLAEA
jgi:hypothetical protein